MLSGLVFGMQTALDPNSRGWAIPTVHLGSRPRLLHHLSASPVVSRTTTNNDILHSCQDKGESRDGRGKLGCRGTPPKPCTSLGGARSGRRGPPGGAGMVGQKGGLGAMSVGYTRAHPKEQRLTCVWGLSWGSQRDQGSLVHWDTGSISAYWGQGRWATGLTGPVCPYWPQEK